MDGEDSKLTLHSFRPLRRRIFNRLFAVVYSTAIAVLFYRHVRALLRPTTATSLLISLTMFAADIVLAFMWLNVQACRMNPVAFDTFPENVCGVLSRPEDFPALDVFICTADPDKEPPMRVAATALSVMAYGYPAEKLSVYVSDDGWSERTLYALM